MLFRLSLLLLALAAESLPAQRTFAVDGSHFSLDGKPFQIISGEMHYPRIPREYWRARFRMARAMGLNTITTYVFWNEHEPAPGVFDFTANNDVAEFIREAQQEGLYVILRPGPYVCAEWEFGGYPAWLLKTQKTQIHVAKQGEEPLPVGRRGRQPVHFARGSSEDRPLVIRSADPKYMALTRRYLKRLAEEVGALQIGNGGPIIAVQIENEYGSFGDDHAYMRQMQDALVEAGFTKSLLYTADGPEQVPNGSLPGVAVGINFGGSDDAAQSFEILKKYRPNGPFFNSEFWDGWFDHWGAPHAHTDTAKQAANLKWMLEQGYSVSLYMFHGGTSFGWMNGANSNGKNYEPDVTSYDYDSPLDESGRPVKKYFLFRDVIQQATGVTPPAVPSVAPAISVDAFGLPESVSLWDSLPAPVEARQTLPVMEDLDQAYGYILYRAVLPKRANGSLVLNELHDYAQVYVNGKWAGTLDRRLGTNSVAIKARKGARLDVLVENTGRVNFTTVLRGERKGVTKEITLAGKPLNNWSVYSLPMKQVAGFSSQSCSGPCFYRGHFSIAKPADTFLDTSRFSKGQVWLNGRPLGRIWNIGPQKTLYVPAPWLKAGDNEVIVFDLNGKPGNMLAGFSEPRL